MCNVGGREKQAISSLRKKRGLENRTTCLLLEEKTRWIAYQGGGASESCIQKGVWVVGPLFIFIKYPLGRQLIVLRVYFLTNYGS